MPLFRHGGVFGSKLCADQYCQDILKDVNNKSLIYEGNDDLFDVYFCDAVYRITKLMNAELKSRSRTGTTVNCLFIRTMIDGTHHVYNINIGDSRCIMDFNNIAFPVSEDHSLNSTRELLRIRSHLMAEWDYMPSQLKLIPVKKIHKDDKSIMYRRIFPTINQIDYAKYILSQDVNDQGIIDDVKQKTYQRSNRTSLPFFPSTPTLQRKGSVSELTSTLGSSMKRFIQYSPRTITADISDHLSNMNGEHDGDDGDDVLEEETTLSQKVYGDVVTNVSAHSFSASNHSSHGLTRPTIGRGKNILDSLDVDDEYITMDIKQEKSFIAKRKAADGTPIGPLALFSRHEVSVYVSMYGVI